MVFLPKISQKGGRRRSKTELQSRVPFCRTCSPHWPPFGLLFGAKTVPGQVQFQPLEGKRGALAEKRLPPSELFPPSKQTRRQNRSQDAFERPSQAPTSGPDPIFNDFHGFCDPSYTKVLFLCFYSVSGDPKSHPHNPTTASAIALKTLCFYHAPKQEYFQ